MKLTVIICARDAGRTIERAVASVLYESTCDLILVDDHSRDDTVFRARRVAGARLRVVSAPEPGGIPGARQAGLNACESEFAAWLDADDEWISGRAARIIAALESGADVFVEPLQLVDGMTNRVLRTLTIPSFVRRESVPARLFERNYLPGDSQIGFRVGRYRDVGGYDPAVFGAESFDILLRAVAAGAKFVYGNTIGYRMFAYPDSVSRHLDRQRAAVAVSLKKHDYENVYRLCLATGETPQVAAWVLISMAIFRKEPDAALRFLVEAFPGGKDMAEALEPDGPYPIAEGWRFNFTRGTLELLIEGGDLGVAADALGSAVARVERADALNNLGVALRRLGRYGEAEQGFRRALELFPIYADARSNLADPSNEAISTHPLRFQPSRSEY